MSCQRPVLLEERRLARRAVQGDESAFAEIVRRHQGAVFRMCLRYVSRTDAEDLAQETFLRAFLHRERFDPERPLAPWLLTIARRLSIDRIRKKREVHGEAVEEAPSANPGADAEAGVYTRERLVLLQEALGALAEGPREAISLYHLEGMAYRDIAAALDVPMGTVMTWLHRGRAELRKLLEAAEGES
jgi:RNA polymerase sigma-70 factor (ECF subfamily)